MAPIDCWDLALHDPVDNNSLWPKAQTLPQRGPRLGRFPNAS